MFTPRAVLLLTAAKLPHHHGEHILNKFLDALKVSVLILGTSILVHAAGGTNDWNNSSLFSS